MRRTLGTHGGPNYKVKCKFTLPIVLIIIAARRLLRRVFTRASQLWKERLSSHNKYLEQYQALRQAFLLWHTFSKDRSKRRRNKTLALAAGAFHKRKAVKRSFFLWKAWRLTQKHGQDCVKLRMHSFLSHFQLNLLFLVVKAKHNHQMLKTIFYSWQIGAGVTSPYVKEFQNRWRCIPYLFSVIFFSDTYLDSIHTCALLKKYFQHGSYLRTKGQQRK